MAMDRSLPNRMIRAAKLDPELYEEVENDESATSQAALVVTIAALAAGVAALIRDGVGTAIVGIIGALIGWVVWAAITYFVGKTFFATAETQVDMGEMMRALGFSYAPGVLSIVGFVPILGGIVALVVGIWQLIAGVIAVRQALDVSTGRAVGTVIVGWLVQLAITFVIFLVISPFLT